MKRTIFIGDIHWCYREFKELIKKLNITPEDKVYLVWDFIDKWKYSYKILKFLIKNQSQFNAILWNKELEFIEYLNSGKLYNKNNKIFKKLKNKLNNLDKKNSRNFKNKSLNIEIKKYLNNLPLYIDDKNFLLIHWWLNFNKSIKNHSKQEITSIRLINWEPWYLKYKDYNKKIIYWHWALNWLNICWNTIWLDSWCVYWKALTAYVLETWDIIQVNSFEAYINVFT